MTKAYSSAKRVVTLFFFLAVAFVIYSVFAPVWVYGVLFGKLEEPGFVSYGLGAPFRDFPRLSVIAVFLIIALIIVSLVARRASRFFTRRALVVFLGSVGVFIVTATIVRVSCEGLYKEATQIRNDVAGQRAMNDMMRNVGEISGKGQVPEVAYFLYLDRTQVTSLYSQIEPEWLEKKRIVTESSSENAKAGGSAGPVSGELAVSRGQQRQSVQEPPATTPERKCQKLMQYAVDRKGAKQYQTGFLWLLFNFVDVANKRTIKPAREAQLGTQLPLNRAEMRELKASGDFIFDNSAETNNQINQDLKQKDRKKLLTSELTSPPDFIFVKGNFRLSKTGALLLVHDFIGEDGNMGIKGDRFRPIQFEVTFPPGTNDADLEKNQRAQLTVFGKVMHGLDQKGIVEVRALAVY